MNIKEFRGLQVGDLVQSIRNNSIVMIKTPIINKYIPENAKFMAMTIWSEVDHYKVGSTVQVWLDCHDRWDIISGANYNGKLFIVAK